MDFDIPETNMRLRQIRGLPYAREIDLTIAVIICLVVLAFIVGHLQESAKALSFALAVSALGAAIAAAVFIIAVMDYIMGHVLRAVFGSAKRPKFVHTKKQSVVNLAEGGILLAMAMTEAGSRVMFFQYTLIFTVMFLAAFALIWAIEKIAGLWG
jgi:hypothetical protein